MAIIMAATGVWIDYDDLAEDEYHRIMSLICDSALRLKVEAGELEVKGDTFYITEKGEEAARKRMEQDE
jgi:hypothetical protein